MVPDSQDHRQREDLDRLLAAYLEERPLDPATPGPPRSVFVAIPAARRLDRGGGLRRLLRYLFR